MKLVVLFFGVVYNISKWCLWPILWWKKQKRKALPPMDEPMLLLSATILADKIRKRLISSEEIVQAYIKRIKLVNPILNAVIEDRFKDAIEDARKVDEYITNTALTEEELEKYKPLLGIPVTIKQSCALEGLSFSVGSLKRASVKAANDGAAVRRLREAGAIPLLVSNTPELCVSPDCNNLIAGATCNPYDNNHSSGGSSGGEGALVGSGASIIGLGSDLAGSVRLPAMFNGVFGHKSTPGVISIEGHWPISPDKSFGEYFTLGPLTRFAEDLKLMVTVLNESMSREIQLHEKVDLSSLTIYHVDEVPGYSFTVPAVQQEIKDAIADAVTHLGKVCHCKISDYKFQELNASLEISVIKFFAVKTIPNILKDSENPEQEDNLYVEFLKCIFGASQYYHDTLIFYLFMKVRDLISPEKYNQYESAYNLLRELFLRKLNTSGVFLYPTFPTSAFRHGELLAKVTGILYTMLFNVLGFPATQIPMGLDKDGLPIGIQVVAAPNQDRLCIAVAVELEKRFGGWIPPNIVNN